MKDEDESENEEGLWGNYLGCWDHWWLWRYFLFFAFWTLSISIFFIALELSLRVNLTSFEVKVSFIVLQSCMRVDLR